MTEKKTRVGVVGAGYISDPHLEALRRIPEVMVVALCDLSPGRVEGLAARFGVPKTYLSVDEMLASEELDVLHVLTPPESHEGLVKRAIDAGLDVFIEKPLAATAESSSRIRDYAAEHQKTVGVSHNFLFYEPYEQLRKDVREGRLGALDQVDIVWNKELGQIKAGPHTGWLFSNPENVLVEVGPHSLTHLLDLLGVPDRLMVSAGDRVTLPTGQYFYRRWEAIGWHGQTSVRLRWSFVSGFPEHYIHVRGRSARAVVDLERNTYVRSDHTAQILDLDRFATSARHAHQEFVGGATTVGKYLLGKFGLVAGGKIFADSIARAASAYYKREHQEGLDSRLAVELGVSAVRLAEQVGRAAKVERQAPVVTGSAVERPQIIPRVLVLGGTGFIGRALVKKLVQSGHSVRALVRDTRTPHPELSLPGVELVRGDFTDTASVVPALAGIDVVYHLARGHGDKWEEYQKYDVEPTLRLAKACLASGVRRFVYTSTIAIYWAGRRAGRITESTVPHPGVLRTSLYARAKVAIEEGLREALESTPLELIIVRPGVVIGRGGSPLHWGIGAWPYPSVCRLWGSGRHPVPFVLVDDCADALVATLDAKDVSGRSFNLVGDVPLTGHGYLDALESAGGIAIKRIETTPAQLLAEESAKWLIKSMGRHPGVELPSWFDSDGRTLAASFDCSAAKSILGWQPTSDRATLIREGIEVPAAEFLS